ncbi:MAG: glutamine synthetase family protein [Arthrobacter sp.]
MPESGRDDELVFVATNDLSAITRGRAMRMGDLDLDTGCGWVPANIGIGPFGSIVDGIAFGSIGDLRLIPDAATMTRIAGIPNQPPVNVVLADITHTDGSPWECCPRTFLRQAIEDLRSETGLSVHAAFEHEFMLLSEETPEAPFSYQALRSVEPMGTELMQILSDAGLDPENWLPEYGAHQWELTVGATDALAAADRAVLLRDIVRDYARSTGRRASFSPLVNAEGSGNGAHVHLSLRDADGTPATYDAELSGRLSKAAGSFAAGILRHTSAIVALTSPSDVSYLRLSPHRWSAAQAFLGERNREAMLRVCPTIDMAGRDIAPQFNLEFRAGDAAGNPWLSMGALIRAGLEGIRAGLPTPVVVDRDVEELSDQERGAAGVSDLPSSLAEALEALEADATVRGWFAPDLMDIHRAIKRDEINQLVGLSEAEKCRRYTGVY